MYFKKFIITSFNYRWDAFNQNEEGRGSASEKHTDLIKKASYCLKITTGLVFFIIVFVAACISKGALFFMIAQIIPPHHLQETTTTKPVPTTTSKVYLPSYAATDDWDLANMTNPPLQYCPDLVPVTTSGSSGAYDDSETTTVPPSGPTYYVYYEEAQSISWMW